MAECVRCKCSFPDTEIQRNWEILFGRSDPIHPTVQALMDAGGIRFFRPIKFGICGACANGLNTERFRPHALNLLNNAVETQSVVGRESLRDAVLLAAFDPIPATELSVSMSRYGYLHLTDPENPRDIHTLNRFHEETNAPINYHVTRRMPVGYGLQNPPAVMPTAIPHPQSPIRPSNPPSSRPAQLSNPSASSAELGPAPSPYAGPSAILAQCGICFDTKPVKKVCECAGLLCADCFKKHLRLKDCPFCRRLLPFRWKWFVPE